MLIDSHCHLDFPDFDGDRPQVLMRARAAGVGAMITISTRVDRYDVYRDLAERESDVYFTIGTHPHQANETPEVSIEELVARASHPRCVGIGEAGLDYHYDRTPRDVAARVFRTHIAAARRADLPLVIHARDADEDVAAILTDEMAKGPFRAVLHCFTASRGLAETAVRLGLYISFSGVITFKKSEDLRAIARAIPADRLLVETDAPFLAPAPNRGKRNEPAFVADTTAALARTRDEDPAITASATARNTLTLFSKMSDARAAT